jgi:hypothetical protein
MNKKIKFMRDHYLVNWPNGFGNRHIARPNSIALN